MHDGVGLAGVDAAGVWLIGLGITCAPGAAEAGDPRLSELLEHRQVVPSELLVKPPIVRNIVELHSPKP